VVAANGLLQKEVDNGDSVTYIWEATEPMASYVAAVSIDEYVIETEQDPDGILIRNYLPADFPEASKAGIDQTTDMLSFFSEHFGPYPFDAYGIVIVDFPRDALCWLLGSSVSFFGIFGRNFPNLLLMFFDKACDLRL
jgi:aminopeptidase N